MFYGSLHFALEKPCGLLVNVMLPTDLTARQALFHSTELVDDDKGLFQWKLQLVKKCIG